MPNTNLFEDLYNSIGINPHMLKNDPTIARIEIHHNQVLGIHLVPGLQADAKETRDGIEAKIKVEKNSVIEKPIQVCFGMMPESGVQSVMLDMEIEENAKAGIFAYCVFPNAKKIRHEMDAVLKIGAGAEYSYSERHVHGAEGGVLVLPKSKVHILEGGRYATDFELIRGRVGEIDIEVETIGEAYSVSEVTARISGSGNDIIKINEISHLVGEGAHGVLMSHIALRDTARAEILNTLTASAPYARGHVDCKEIVQDMAIAKAVPIVEVNHPKAHITHEAAIGSVDSKQLETLMSRGIDEDDAVDLIIQGLLSKPKKIAA